jgi:hypothetical protein
MIRTKQSRSAVSLIVLAALLFTPASHVLANASTVQEPVPVAGVYAQGEGIPGCTNQPDGEWSSISAVDAPSTNGSPCPSD